MTNSKPLPPFIFDVLCYLTRDQLEQLSIICRSLKNVKERYFRSKPYRIFDRLAIMCGGSYALVHNGKRWQLNRDDYSVQQFLAGQRCNDGYADYSFVEIRPYLDPTVRVKQVIINVVGNSIYNTKHIEEMESIAYLWHAGYITVWSYDCRIVAKYFLPILNSPTILQCQILCMDNAQFSFKDYTVLYTVKVIVINDHDCKEEDVNTDAWLQFLEQPRVKPVLVLYQLRERIDNVINIVSKAFSSAILPNIFKIVFAQTRESLSEFKETNKTSGETLELKKGLPVEYQREYLKNYDNYTLERSSS